MDNIPPKGILCSYTAAAQRIINETGFKHVNFEYDDYDHNIRYIGKDEWQALETLKNIQLDQQYGEDGTLYHVVAEGTNILSQLFDDYKVDIKCQLANAEADIQVQWADRICRLTEHLFIFKKVNWFIDLKYILPTEPEQYVPTEDEKTMDESDEEDSDIDESEEHSDAMISNEEHSDGMISEEKHSENDNTSSEEKHSENDSMISEEKHSENDNIISEEYKNGDIQIFNENENGNIQIFNENENGDTEIFEEYENGDTQIFEDDFDSDEYDTDEPEDTPDENEYYFRDCHGIVVDHDNGLRIQCSIYINNEYRDDDEEYITWEQVYDDDDPRDWSIEIKANFIDFIIANNSFDLI